MVWLRRQLRVDRIGWLFAGVVTVGLVGLIVYALSSQQDTIHNLRARNATIAAQSAEGQKQYRSLVDEYTKLTDQAKAAGVDPDTVDPSDIPQSIAGPAGSAGARGSSGEDGRGVAFSLCTATGWAVTYTDGTTENGAGDCTGATGKTGPAGKDGAVGASGKDGADGVSITGPSGATGAAGPAGPAGPAGAAGAAGADGTDGVGVATVTCTLTDDGSTVFRFALTDGTTQDVPGACTPAPATPEGDG